MGHIKTTEEEKKLYYSCQCQLVWHAAVSPTLLPIHKKNIFSSHGVSMNNITSQTTRPPACPVTYGTRVHRDTEEPGDSRISTTISLRCRKPARGAKKRLRHSTFSVHQHAAWNKDTCLSSNAHVLTITPTFSPPSLLALEPSCLIKSISCASAVPRQWLSNKSCYSVASRWELEQNLFRKASLWSQQSCSLRFASRKPSWINVRWDRATTLDESSSTWHQVRESEKT